MGPSSREGFLDWGRRAKFLVGGRGLGHRWPLVSNDVSNSFIRLFTIHIWSPLLGVPFRCPHYKVGTYSLFGEGDPIIPMGSDQIVVSCGISLASFSTGNQESFHCSLTIRNKRMNDLISKRMNSLESLNESINTTQHSRTNSFSRVPSGASLNELLS